MFLLGHLGIGSQLVKPWSKGLSRRLILVGTVLPDLMDKPLYYTLSLITGKRGAEIGLISGTRTFGHTGILLFAVTLLAVFRRSKPLAALSLGIASHILLDSLNDQLLTPDKMSSAVSALLWPITNFPPYPFRDVGEQVSNVANPVILWGEIIGVSLLSWDYWKTKHRGAWVRSLNENRSQSKKPLKKRR